MPHPTLTAEFQIVTPLFMSGADQNQAELRLPSIKGALRFWWRAIALGRLKTRQAVKKEEARLFGSTDHQALFHLRLRANLPQPLEARQVLKYSGGEVVGPGARYMGYGVMEAFASRNKGTVAGELTRPCYPAPFNGQIDIRFQKDTPAADIQQIQQAVIALSLLGGIGSKSRKGYGSFNLTALRAENEVLWELPQNAEDYQRQLVHFCRDLELFEGQPPFTAFSTESRVDLLAKATDPMRLLNTVGEALQLYRSWGKDGKVNGRDAERRFKDDHDWFKAAEVGDVEAYLPKRAVFGLPHNYSRAIGCEPENSREHGRRASPLFFHVQKMKDGDYVATAIILPAVFLEEKVRVGVINGRGPSKLIDAAIDYSVLTEFLTGSTKQGNKRFPNRIAVIPR